MARPLIVSTTFTLMQFSPLLLNGSLLQAISAAHCCRLMLLSQWKKRLIIIKRKGRKKGAWFPLAFTMQRVPDKRWQKKEHLNPQCFPSRLNFFFITHYRLMRRRPCILQALYWISAVSHPRCNEEACSYFGIYSFTICPLYLVIIVLQQGRTSDYCWFRKPGISSSSVRLIH